MELSGTYDVNASGGTVQVKRQAKKQDAASDGFSYLLNGMLAANPLGGIKTNTAESPSHEDKTASTSANTRASRVSKPAEGKTMIAKQNTGQTEETPDTKDEEEITNQSGARHSRGAPAESENRAQDVPKRSIIWEPVRQTEAGEQGRRHNAPHATADTESEPWSQDETRQQAMMRAAGNIGMRSHGARTGGVSFSESYARGMRERENAWDAGAPNASQNTGQGTQARNARLEGMIARAARELGEASIGQNENRLAEPRTIRAVQPLTQLERTPVIGYVSRTESISTAVVEGMNREEANTPQSQIPTVSEQGELSMQRINQSGDSFRPAERIKTGRPETGEEAQVSTALNVREPYDPIEKQVADMSGQRPAGASDQTQQIQAEVLRNLENTKMEFRMQLQPEELGRIDIKMALQDGKLMLEIVSSAKTSELISRQLEDLATTLRQNSPDLTSVQIVSAARETAAGQLGSALNNGSGTRQGEDGESGAGPGKNQTGGFQQESGMEATGPSRLLDYAV